MSQPVITVENLSKAYRIGSKEASHDTLMSAVTHTLRSPLRNLNRLRRLSNIKQGQEAEDILWALKDVSFDVHEGEVVGIIGRNGAGKSTLLKVLSRITQPTGGRVVIRGRVSSLLEVGTGFHPELSGRDNIYMNGTILGMRKKEIDRKFDEIVDFSGVERFLDTPTKRYSSGMQVRLAFAVAAHLEPEILIIDEVLAVGDAEFQRKCLGKMQDVATTGRTVLFVSHNMASLEALCSRAIAIEAGKLVEQGDVATTIRNYRERAFASLEDIAGKNSLVNADYFEEVELVDEFGEPTPFTQIGQSLSIRMKIAAPGTVTDPRIRIRFHDLLGNCLLMVQPPLRTAEVRGFSGATEVICRIPEFPLAPGRYQVGVSLAESREMLENLPAALTLMVEDAELFDEGRGFTKGLIAARSEWMQAVST